MIRAGGPGGRHWAAGTAVVEPGAVSSLPGRLERIECSRGACVASRTDGCGETHGHARALLFWHLPARRGAASARLPAAQADLLHEESPLQQLLAEPQSKAPPLVLPPPSVATPDYPLPLQWLPRGSLTCAARHPLEERAGSAAGLPLLYPGHRRACGRGCYVRELMHWAPVVRAGRSGREGGAWG